MVEIRAVQAYVSPQVIEEVSSGPTGRVEEVIDGLPDVGYYLELLARRVGYPKVIAYDDQFDESVVEGRRVRVPEPTNALTGLSLIVIPLDDRKEVYEIALMKNARDFGASAHPWRDAIRARFGVFPIVEPSQLSSPEDSILFYGRLTYSEGGMSFTHDMEFIPPGVNEEQYARRRIQLAHLYLRPQNGQPSHVQRLLVQAASR